MNQEDLTKWAYLIAGPDYLKEPEDFLKEFMLLVTQEARAESALQRQLRKEVSEELTPLETLISKYAGAYSTPEATTLQVLQDLLNELQGWRNGHVLQGFQEDLTAMQMRALDAEKEVVKLKEELSKAKAIIEEYDIRPDC